MRWAKGGRSALPAGKTLAPEPTVEAAPGTVAAWGGGTAVLYQDGDISVDRDFARCGAKAYAINEIDTVKIRETKQTTGCAVAILTIIGAGALFSGIESPTFGDLSIGNFLVSAVMIGLAYSVHKNGPRYIFDFFLMTSSPETSAFTTSDREQVNALRQAIEQAMTVR